MTTSPQVLLKYEPRTHNNQICTAYRLLPAEKNSHVPEAQNSIEREGGPKGIWSSIQVVSWKECQQGLAPSIQLSHCTPSPTQQSTGQLLRATLLTLGRAYILLLPGDSASLVLLCGHFYRPGLNTPSHTQLRSIVRNPWRMV